MFDLILQWSKRMANKVRKAAGRRPRELPPIELIAIEEDADLAEFRRSEIRDLLSRLYLSLRRRGRPAQDDQEDNRAA